MWKLLLEPLSSHRLRGENRIGTKKAERRGQCLLYAEKAELLTSAVPTSEFEHLKLVARLICLPSTTVLEVKTPTVSWGRTKATENFDLAFFDILHRIQ
jgi:hypothetical protein